MANSFVNFNEKKIKKLAEIDGFIASVFKDGISPVDIFNTYVKDDSEMERVYESLS